MAASLPAPIISDVGPDNVIDLDALGGADLVTWVKYPGIAEGDEFWPTWWGCTALGAAVDDFNDLVQIGPGELQPEGMPVLIANAKLKALDQGWVFYSYRMFDPSAPDDRGEESLRGFFYVGRRPLISTSLLPVPQFKESHDLAIDLAAIGQGGANIVTLPYRAMSVGDKVTLTLDRYFEVDDPWLPLESNMVLVEADIGKPLSWRVSKNELDIIVGGFAHINYRIDYATPTVPSESAIQTLHVIPPPATLLPAPKFKEDKEEEIDPECYPNGITAVIPLYAGIQVGDDVVVYARGATFLVKTLRVDASTIDSAVLELNLEYEWLSANNGEDVSLTYQYAREGSAHTSQPLEFTLRKPLKLPMPVVERATSDGEGKGFLLADSITGGVIIRLPEDAVIGDSDKVQMHWDGHGSSGSYIADPTVGDKTKFQIPKTAVPANMGKRLNVFYKVTPPGKNSVIFDLEIKDMTTGWPTLQISAPASPGNIVSLKLATDGVTFKLAAWTYMAVGQRLKIQVIGKLSAGGQEVFDLRVGAAEMVTETEYYDGEIQAKLPRAFLLKLQLNQQFNVSIATSFDDGNSYKQFPPIAPQLIAG